MALSDEKIAEIGEACGLGCKIADADYPCDMLWFDGNPTHFARAIEAEVRKRDDALILQLVEALEESAPHTDRKYRWKPEDWMRQRAEAITAGRARLEGKK